MEAASSAIAAVEQAPVGGNGRAEGAWEIAQLAGGNSSGEQKRLQVIQQLLAARGTEGYGGVKREALQTLGISERSLRRLVGACRKQGLGGLKRQQRRDQGRLKTSAEWQKFIVQTYREGNRGSCQMSPAQVYVRVQVRAMELGVVEYPGRTTVYRVLKRHLSKHPPKRSLGWKGERLVIKTRAGVELEVTQRNQLWQIDHTQVDVLVVAQSGELLGRPWLSTVVDAYSRCIMGLHLGFDAPSAEVVCLALRHAILPKQYPVSYQLRQPWSVYGLPQHLYTDGGKDFRSQHLEQVATALGFGLHLRRKPSDGGIVERPFGTFNSEFFSSLPGYTNSNTSERSPQAESDACLTLLELERLLVRYIVDHYNQSLDARTGDQSRMGRWESELLEPPPLLGERDLDLCLMRRERRTIYRSGYLQFASLTYQGEHLAAYAGESVAIRYHPKDITTIWVYQQRDGKEVFLARAHAMGWEAEILSFAEAKALSQRRRQAGRSVSNRSLLEEVRDRDSTIQRLRQEQQQQKIAAARPSLPESGPESPPGFPAVADEPIPDPAIVKPRKPIANVPVYDLEDLKRGAGRW